MGRPKGSKNGETTLINMTCTVCKTKETPQWYTGSVCKSCYRKAHRFANLGKFKEKDKASYEKRKPTVLLRAKEYYLENIEEIKAYRKKYLETNDVPGHTPEYQREWRAKNPHSCVKARAKYLAKYPGISAKHHRTYMKKNPGRKSAFTADYRARRLQATPKWMSKTELLEIVKFYENKPLGFEVDHIVPLKGKQVCGLHVLANLQYLTKKENCSKSNKFLK